MVPEIVDGPVALDRQAWVGTGPPAGQFLPDTVLRSLSGTQLCPSTFVDVWDLADIPPSTKPFWCGLHTSTTLPSAEGLWEIHLDTTRTTLFPRPWYVWAALVRPDARVREIPTATAWAKFVSTYPLEHDGLIYPDWRRVARDYDGVHMTLHAVAATQGLEMRVDGATIAAPYYGLESTFWLHWAFTSPELGAGGGGQRWRARRASRALSACMFIRSSLRMTSRTRESVSITNVTRLVRLKPRSRFTPNCSRTVPSGSESSG